MALSAAVFLDKDGTVLDNVPYNVNPEKMRFAPGAKTGLARLATLGLPLIVISNQSGIALGKFQPEAMQPVRDRLDLMFRQVGARLGGFYFCPHHPDGRPGPYAIRCDCRKPAPGLLNRAALRHGVDVSRSWFVGDILDDVEAGQRAGCHTLLLDNGNETVWNRNAWRYPERIESDLDAASITIVRYVKEETSYAPAPATSTVGPSQRIVT